MTEERRIGYALAIETHEPRCLVALTLTGAYFNIGDGNWKIFGTLEIVAAFRASHSIYFNNIVSRLITMEIFEIDVLQGGVLKPKRYYRIIEDLSQAQRPPK